MSSLRHLGVIATLAVGTAFGQSVSQPGATAGHTRLIEADLSREAGPHSRAALMVVGAGRANEGLRADWQAQLALTQREIGFEYIRFHGLLDDDMGVYTEDATGKPAYNFQYIDTLYDALLALHIRPFVELSFMPAKLAAGTKTVFWYKANISPPKDMNKWEGLMRALITHWRDRYGEPEISKWYFEVWNEPDLKLFFDADLDQYFQLYRVTATTIKSVCRACRVGGPASAEASTEKKFIDYLAANYIPVDFVSTHNYATKSGYLDPATGAVTTLFDASPGAIVDRVCTSRDTIAQSALPKLELHYTEWGSSWTSTDYIHDQYHQASFILDRLRKALPCATSMSYWTFTDIFEERGPRFTPFYGGFGLLTYGAIRKPSYFAYEFLARLGATDVRETDSAARGPQSWITRTGDKQIQALFWDYSPTAPPAGQDDQHFYKREQPAPSADPVTLRLANVPRGRYRLEVYRTGYQINDPYTAYVRMGEPDQLSRQQLTDLQAASSGAPVETRTVTVRDGAFEQTFPMRQNDVYLVTLTRP